MKGIISRWANKRTDFNLGALFIILVLAIALLTGCTEIEPGFVTTSEDSVIQVVDSDGDIITIDEVTGAITAIEYEHHELHMGDSFSCWYMQTVSDTGDKSIISFRTANSARWVHLTLTASATVMAHVRVLEAPAITNNTGATLAVYNRNRNSTTQSTVIDTSQNPSLSGSATYFTELTMGNVVGGTELAHEHLGTGEGKKTVGGTARGQQEWILLPNTLYAVEMESTNDDDNIHIITLNWYEHTNR